MARPQPPYEEPSSPHPAPDAGAPFDTADDAPPPPSHLFAQLQAAMAAEPAPVRTLQHETLWPLLAAGCAPLFLFVLTYRKLSGELAQSALGNLWPTALMALILALLTSYVARSRGAGLGPQASTLGWVALAALPIGLLPLAHRWQQLAAFDSAPARIFVREPYCLQISLSVLALSLFIVSRGMKYSAPVAAGWRSAAVGAAAGAWTALAMLLYCPDVSLVHLLVKHVAPVCLAPIAGYFLLRRYVKL